MSRLRNNEKWLERNSQDYRQASDLGQGSAHGQRRKPFLGGAGTGLNHRKQRAAGPEAEHGNADDQVSEVVPQGDGEDSEECDLEGQEGRGEESDWKQAEDQVVLREYASDNFMLRY